MLSFYSTCTNLSSFFASFIPSVLPSIQDFLGQAFCTLGEIVGSPASRLEKPLGWVTVSANFPTASTGPNSKCDWGTPWHLQSVVRTVVKYNAHSQVHSLIWDKVSLESERITERNWLRSTENMNANKWNGRRMRIKSGETKRHEGNFGRNKMERH